jgi:uncharacterized protein (TIGR00369 family)
MDFPIRIPFVETLGFELLRFDAEGCEIAVTVKDEQTNSWGVAHGGLTMTLLDVVMAHAARSGGAPAAREAGGMVTIEMKTSFMRPGLGRLVATGRLLHRTASTAFTEASVRDTGGQLVAHATGTFKFLRGLPIGDRQIHRLDASD